MPTKFFFPTSRFTQEKEKLEFRQATYKIRRRVFVPRVAQDKKAKDFIQTSYIKGQELEEAKEAVESARAGLSQKRKKKRKTKEGGLSPQEGDVKKRKREKKKTKEGEKVAPQRQGSVCP